jgi:hypothetical protein
MIKKLPITFWVIFLSIAFSLSACFFFFNLNLHVSNFDALSRMNIARKITDNLTPGLGQFGGVWPFLPQLIMVPFTAITPLWHNGIAGMIMSVPAFIISGLLMYLIIFEITKNKFISFIGFLIFITNINLLLLQTMAMSESLFIFFTLGAMYYLLQWQKNPTKSIVPLSFAGAFLSGACLTRYEGILFTIAAIIVVFITILLKRKPLRVAEGITFMFATIALFGIFLWCLYNAAVFKDPINWAKIYAGKTSVIPTEQKEIIISDSETLKNNFPSRITTYASSIAEVNGVPIFIIAIIGFGVFIFSLKPIKDQRSLILLLPLSTVLFMLVILYKSTYPINVPPLNLETIKDFNNTFKNEYNMRYGILLWPFIVFMVAWLMSKHRLLKIVAVLVLIIHLVTPLYHNAFLMYQFPFNWGEGSTINAKVNQARDWFKTNYTGGLILMSALKHDSVMFQLGLPYKTYIHEGAGEYWLTSRVNPEVYAEWIFMADPKNIRGGIAGGEEDPVTKNLQNNQTLKTNYILRFNDGDINIYQRRDESLNASDEGFASMSETTQPNESQGQFTGKMVDQKGNPISGVALSTTYSTTMSNADGEFLINVNKAMTTIRFEKTGFKNVVFTLDLSNSSLDGNKIALTPIREETIFEKILTYL